MVRKPGCYHGVLVPLETGQRIAHHPDGYLEPRMATVEVVAEAKYACTRSNSATSWFLGGVNGSKLTTRCAFSVKLQPAIGRASCDWRSKLPLVEQTSIGGAKDGLHTIT